MIAQGNKKLGKGIMSFSLPPIITCPGKTELCRKICYVKGSRGTGYLEKNRSILDYYIDSYLASLKEDFVDVIGEELREKKPKILRLHVSGDFYNVDYIRKWGRIIPAFPQITFSAFAKSWRIPELKEALEALDFPNLIMIYSAETESGIPETREKIAWLARNEHDIPENAFVVFKDLPQRKRGWFSDVFICPHENGMPDLTCSRCMHCYC